MQVFSHHWMERHVATTAIHLENRGELLDRWIADENLVGNPAQKRFISELHWIEVRGEDGQHVERHLELLSRMQGQVVEAALERHDPAVQQVLRTHPLTTEVVHQEDAAIGLELQRRFVEARQRIESQIEHVERELAADHDHWTTDADPASIPGLGSNDARRRTRVEILERLVTDRIEHGDDVALDVDREGHVHVAADRASESFRQYRLAIARRAVEEDRLVGVCRRTELFEDVIIDDEMSEAVAQTLANDEPT